MATTTPVPSIAPRASSARRGQLPRAAEPAGPGRLLLALHRQQPAAAAARERLQERLGALPLGHHREVGALEVVGEVDVVRDQLPGEQAFDGLAAALGGAPRPSPRLLLVGLPHRGEQAVEARLGLALEAIPDVHRHLRASRLLAERVGRQRLGDKLVDTDLPFSQDAADSCRRSATYDRSQA